MGNSITTLYVAGCLFVLTGAIALLQQRSIGECTAMLCTGALFLAGAYAARRGGRTG